MGMLFYEGVSTHVSLDPSEQHTHTHIHVYLPVCFCWQVDLSLTLTINNFNSQPEDRSDPFSRQLFFYNEAGLCSWTLKLHICTVQLKFKTSIFFSLSIPYLLRGRKILRERVCVEALQQ